METKTPKSAETRARIQNVAVELFARNGYRGTTMRSIAAASGLSLGNAYYYFPSKEDAVLGHDEDAHFPEDLVAEFLGNTGDVTLLQALRTYAQRSGERLALTREEFGQLHAVMQREPEILARFFGESIEREREFAALIARREGLEPDDSRALLAWSPTDNGNTLFVNGEAWDLGPQLGGLLEEICTVRRLGCERLAPYLEDDEHAAIALLQRLIALVKRNDRIAGLITGMRITQEGIDP